MDLSICIVTYNSIRVLRLCLDSLIKSFEKDIDFEIIIVDNGSKDGTVEFVQEKYPSIKLIQNQENLGYTKAMNIGLKQAHGEYLVQLNPDTIIERNSFEMMLSYLDKNPDIGICTPKILNRDGSLQKQCKRSFAYPWDVISYFLGLHRLFPKSKFFGKYLLTYLDENEINDVHAVSGSCMVIRKDVVEQIGYLDERFFAYQEDADFCMRATQAGWRVLYFPHVKITHYGGQGGSKTEPYRAVFEWHKSYFLYYRKNIAKKYFFLINWTMYLAMIIKLVFSLMLTMFRKDKFVGSRKPGV